MEVNDKFSGEGKRKTTLISICLGSPLSCDITNLPMTVNILCSQVTRRPTQLGTKPEQRTILPHLRQLGRQIFGLNLRHIHRLAPPVLPPQQPPVHRRRDHSPQHRRPDREPEPERVRRRLGGQVDVAPDAAPAGAADEHEQADGGRALGRVRHVVARPRADERRLRAVPGRGEEDGQVRDARERPPWPTARPCPTARARSSP